MWHLKYLVLVLGGLREHLSVSTLGAGFVGIPPCTAHLFFCLFGVCSCWSALQLGVSDSPFWFEVLRRHLPCRSSLFRFFGTQHANGNGGDDDEEQQHVYST